MNEMNSKARSRIRILRRYKVEFGSGAQKYTGYTKNFSPEGVGITCRRLLSIGNRFDLKIFTEEKTIEIYVEVRWTSDPRETTAKGMMDEMGLKVLKHNDDFAELVERLILESKPKKREPRIAKGFRVTYDNPNQVVEEYTRDISLGGMFVQTETPEPLNSMIQVRITLMDVYDVITVEARVVHVLDKETADRMNTVSGMGVQFERFEPGDEERFKEYIENLKKEMGLT